MPFKFGKRKHDDGDDDEKSALLRTHPPAATTAYSPGVVGAPSTIIEPPNQYKSRWRSIRIMYLTMFLSSVSFSICMSSIWPYMQVLDSGATASLLGWVVAAYSLGQLIASPIFGAWANFRNKSREPLIISILINVVANVLYAYLESLPEKKITALVLARVFIGFGAGNVAVVRAYVSGATTTKERTQAMANMSAFQAVGFICGPAIQTALVPIGYPGPLHTTAIHLDLYTTPALLSSLVGIINILCVIFVFSEHRVQSDEDINFSVQNGAVMPDYSPDFIGVVSSLLIFFVVLFIFAVFETIATPLTMHMLSWTREEATLYIGIILACGGVISIVVFMIIKILSKRYNERYLMLFGFVFCFVGFIVYLPWGNDYPDYEVATIDNSQNVTGYNFTTIIPSTTQNGIAFPQQAGMVFTNNQRKHNGILGLFSSSASNETDVEPRGCPDSYAWCAYTPRISLAQFLIGTFFIVVGYPTCNVMSYTLFSKILGPKPQGTMMGLLTASGSLARTLGPVYVSQVYNAFGPRVTFISLAVVVFLTFFAVIGVFKKLVPFSFSTKEEV